MLDPDYEWPDKSEETQKADLRAKVDAMGLLKSPFFFTRFLEDVRRAGLVRERRNAQVLFIAGVSRLRPRPLSILVKGSSSAGKNFLARKVLDFFTQESVHEISSMSAQALNFIDKSDLKNHILYFYEIGGTTRPVHPNRLLLSENQLVHLYTKEGKTEEKVTRGPVACVSTTSEERLAIDDENRHFSVWIDESVQQTRRIAKAYIAPTEQWTATDVALWHEVQRLLEERKDLPINTPPWFARIVDWIPTYDVRIRRYWPGYVEACKTVCLIRSFSQHYEDLERAGGSTVSFEDFAITNLIFDRVVAESLLKNATAQEITTGEMVEHLSKDKSHGVDATDLSREPGVTSKKEAYKLLRAAARAGTIFHSNPHEKNNRKLYLPLHEARFLGLPETIFRNLKIEPVKIVHPIKGEWITYEPKAKS